MLLSGLSSRASDVTTYHYDAGRTGYNATETLLTPATVGSSAFTRITTTAFTGHVDAQPLLVSAKTWAQWGYATRFPHDVVYIATSNNDLFAIDGQTGQILMSRNFGAAVPMTTCNNNAATMGITSTPVINPASESMYLMTYTVESGAPVYRLHSVSLANLSDLLPSTVVAASTTLSNGTSFSFQPAYQRQRPALLLANGNVYAGFGSFCDQNTQRTRGWLMGWGATNLSPLSTSAVMNEETPAQVGNGLNLGWTVIDYMSSIWMSGSGPAADADGNIYVQTGNSNAERASNYPDSVVKVGPWLNSIVDFFTPSNFAYLDDNDLDRGAAGVMVVPEQSGGSQFAVAGGKDGRLFLFNQNGLGGYVANGPDVPASVNAGACWCAPAYFVGSDGHSRILSTGGTQVQTWFLPTSAGGSLAAEASAVALPSTDGQDPGFMASVSSNGQNPNTGVIWSVSRSSGGNVYLQALDATAGTGGNSITDLNGNVWSLGAATRNLGEHWVLLNGKSTPYIAVKLVIANNGRAYHLAGNGLWYYGNGTSPAQAAVPPGTRPESPVGATLGATQGGSITDAAGNVWAFGPNLRNPGEHNIVLNGVPTGGWAVKLVIATSGAAWHYNYYGQWFTGNGTTWTQEANAPLLVQPSAPGATITKPGSSLTDIAGNVWSFGTQQRNPGEYEIYVNGQPSGWGWAVKMVAAFGGTVWQYNYNHNWYTNNDAGGTLSFPAQSTAPAIVNAAVGSTAWPAASGELRELQLVSAGAWSNVNNNANVVPVVANGHVYVATDNQLQIWGLQ